MVWLAPVLVALCLGLLVWVLADAADGLMQRARHHRQRHVEHLGHQLEAIFLFVDPARLALLNGALLALGMVAAWVFTGSLVTVLLVMVLLLILPKGLYRWIRRRRLKKLEGQLPDAILGLAGSLRAGCGLNSALIQLADEVEAPLAQEVGLIVREQRLGVPQDIALDNFARRVPLPMVVLLVSTIRIATETGGELAEALTRAAHTLRAIAQAEGKIDALTAQGRMQAWVVGLLPLLLLWVLHRMEPEAMSRLWTTPIGWGTLAAMIFMECMGVWLIHRIVSIDV